MKNAFKKKVKIFFNTHPIDGFVDDFWLYNCSKDKSTCQINDCVRKLLHQIVQLGHHYHSGCGSEKIDFSVDL
jgi:hypothetical protein